MREVTARVVESRAEVPPVVKTGGRKARGLVRITFFAGADDVETAKAAAKTEGLTDSDIFRRAIREWAQRYKKAKGAA